MNNEEHLAIKKLIVGLAEIYGVTLSPARFNIYFDVLSQYPAAEVEQAIKEVALDPTQRFFPLPAVLVEKINPTTSVPDAAQEILERCIAAVTKFGYYNPGDACKYIGEVGWEALPDGAGWSEFCQTPMGQAVVTRAQLRERIAAKLRSKPVSARQPMISSGTYTPQITKNIDENKGLGDEP